MIEKPITIVGIPSLQADARRVSEIIEMIRNHPKNISGFVKSLGFKELAGHKLFALEKTESVSGALIIKQSDNVNKIADIRLIFKDFNLLADDIDAIRQIIENLLPEYTKIRVLAEENDYDIIGVLKKIGFVFESGLPAEIFTSLGYKNAQSFVYCTAPDRKIIDVSREKTSNSSEQKNILLEEKLEKIQEMLGNKNIEVGIKTLKKAIEDKDAKIKTAGNLIREQERMIAELKEEPKDGKSAPEKSERLSGLIAKFEKLTEEVEKLTKKLNEKQMEIENLREQNAELAKLRKQDAEKGEMPRNCEEKIKELEAQLKDKSDRIIRQAKEIEKLKKGEKTPEDDPEKTDSEQKIAEDKAAAQDSENKKSPSGTSEEPVKSADTLKTDSPINAVYALLEEKIKDQDLNGFSAANMKKILKELYNKDNQKLLLSFLDFNQLGFDFLQAKAMCEKLKQFGILKIDNPGSLFRIRFTDETADLLKKPER